MVIGVSSLGELDPARASGIGLHLIRTACDGLTSLDNSTGESRPALAKNAAIEPGALKMTLDLTPKLTFTDGAPVDAQAVRESLSRVARPTTASRWATLLERVEGFAEVQSGQATHLTGIKVMSPLTMEIAFSTPAGDFLATLAHPSLTPISGGGAGDGNAALNCSGPYRVEPGASQGSFNLTRRRSSASLAPDTIRVESFETAADSFAALIEGKVDLAQRPENQIAIPTGISVEHGTGSEMAYLAFDTSKSPGSDPNLVRAFSLAVDRLVIVDAAYGDRRQPALRWLPGQAAIGESPCAKYIRRIAHPELAKQTLGGHSGSVALTYDASVLDRFAAQAIQVQVKAAVGIDVQLMGLESEAFTASARDRPEGGAWLFETDTDFIRPDQSLFELFKTGRPRNRLGYSNADIDGAFEAWRGAAGEIRPKGAEQAQASSARAIVKAEEMLCAETPAVPLWRTVHHWAFNPKKVFLKGEDALDTFGMPVWRD